MARVARGSRRAPVAPAPAIDGPLAAYADAHTSDPPALLAAIARETEAIADRPIMLSGKTVGRLLAMLSATIRPKLAVDVGTFTGYSALCLAEGLAPGGRVITCEVDPAAAAIAARNFARSPHRKRIELRVGRARDTLRALPARIELAFVDADKGQYWDDYDAIVERLAPRGLVVVDNTLLFGLVLASERDARTLPAPIQKMRRAIRAFNRRVHRDPRTEQCLLTVRDGITLVRRRPRR